MRDKNTYNDDPCVDCVDCSLVIFPSERCLVFMSRRIHTMSFTSWTNNIAWAQTKKNKSNQILQSSCEHLKLEARLHDLKFGFLGAAQLHPAALSEGMKLSVQRPRPGKVERNWWELGPRLGVLQWIGISRAATQCVAEALKSFSTIVGKTLEETILKSPHISRWYRLYKPFSNGFIVFFLPTCQRRLTKITWTKLVRDHPFISLEGGSRTMGPWAASPLLTMSRMYPTVVTDLQKGAPSKGEFCE